MVPFLFDTLNIYLLQYSNSRKDTEPPYWKDHRIYRALTKVMTMSNAPAFQKRRRLETKTEIWPRKGLRPGTRGPTPGAIGSVKGSTVHPDIEGLSGQTEAAHGLV